MPALSRLLLGGFLTLAVVMGVGRFVYTPLLPLMQAAEGFGPEFAGLLASANFAGYLAGSLAMSLVPRGPARIATFRAGLVASVATTVAMGLTGDPAWWLVLRTLSGIASAAAMILAAGMAVEALAAARQERLVAWLFGGVGAGIAASGLLVRFASAALSWDELWIAAGLASALAVPLAWTGVRELGREQSAIVERPAPTRPAPRPFPFKILASAYFCEGLGYSVFATFIVALVKARPGLEALGDSVWIVVGLAGMPSCYLWQKIAARTGYAAALLLAYLAQVIGVLLPAVSDHPIAAVLAAILFGGTFMGITLLTLPIAHRSAVPGGFALITAGFGLGQMLGPILAGWLAEGAGYAPGLIGSAAVLAVGAALIAGGIALRRRA